MKRTCWNRYVKRTCAQVNRVHELLYSSLLFLTVAVLHTRQIFGPGSVNSNSIDWFFFFFVVLPPPFPLPLPPLMQDHIAYYR